IIGLQRLSSSLPEGQVASLVTQQDIHLSTLILHLIGQYHGHPLSHATGITQHQGYRLRVSQQNRTGTEQPQTSNQFLHFPSPVRKYFMDDGSFPGSCSGSTADLHSASRRPGKSQHGSHL